MRRQRGFTLVELMVVLLLVGIILAMTGLSLGDDDTTAVRDEAERVALLLLATQQEAVLAGRVIAVRFDELGYQFFEVNEKNEFQPWEREHWRQRAWGPAIVPMWTTATEQQQNQGVLFEPTGEMTAFTLTLSRGKARWRVEGKAHGEITLAPQV